MNALAPIRVFSWFHDPNVQRHSHVPSHFLNFLVYQSLPHFGGKTLDFFDSSFKFLLITLPPSRNLLKLFQKSTETGVIGCLHQKRQRKDLRGVLINFRVVIFDVEK